MFCGHAPTYPRGWREWKLGRGSAKRRHDLFAFCRPIGEEMAPSFQNLWPRESSGIKSYARRVQPLNQGENVGCLVRVNLRSQEGERL
jgi:hypothetical protein